MIIKEMTITNSRGDSITFGRHFCLERDFELSGTAATVNYSETTVDGSHYQNTKMENKDIDIPFFIYKSINEPWWIEERRNEAYKVFNPKANPMRIDITTKGGEEYYINANLEGAPSFPTGFENDNNSWQKGLLQFSANDPYFYTKNEKKVDIALWVGTFEFPLEIPEEGIEMGYREPSLIVNVLNDGQESTGMMIRFKALGTLTNPSLINVNTYEMFKLKTTMQPGDVIEVSTYQRRKSVTLIRNGQRSNIFNDVDIDVSKFLQLEIGDNLFRYDAGSGLDNLEVSMTFTPRLLGV